ncbi:hypothetical protein Vadar_032323 [Vaccinium darrowii]|uniref:Uncharacterized protein n=1 Tax=Vaccinium darrowii TaxID=229202 RepID=A0ACB7Z222_9ERIC|nr:hypothetical protein Vadar_032323 [Vaccinium darrowii]
MVRVRGLPHDRETYCMMAVNNWSRMEPPLPNEYFGNSVQILGAKASVGELMEQGFGWAERRLLDTVAGYSDAEVRQWVEKWIEDPCVYQLGQIFNPFSTIMASSLRFPMYGNEFGMEKRWRFGVGMRISPTGMWRFTQDMKAAEAWI